MLFRQRESTSLLGGLGVGGGIRGKSVYCYCLHRLQTPAHWFILANLQPEELFVFGRAPKALSLGWDRITHFLCSNKHVVQELGDETIGAMVK